MSEKVHQTLTRIDAPIISPLVDLEFHSALSIKVRGGEMTAQVARRWISGFSMPLRTLDALHLATASTHGLTLITADRDLARSAGELGVDCEPLA